MRNFSDPDDETLGPIGEREPTTAAVPLAEETPARTVRPGKPHWVVVTTRPVIPVDNAPPGSKLATRFWHPRDRRWSVNYFDSIDHALRLFIDESGWTLLQQQVLDAAGFHELIFEARDEDFKGPTTIDLLAEVGLTPEKVEKLLSEGELGKETDEEDDEDSDESRS